MKKPHTAAPLPLACLLAALAAPAAAGAAGRAALYTTTADRSRLLAREPVAVTDAPDFAPSDGELRLDPARRRQAFDGFGAALTESSCLNLLKMPAPLRAALLRETFSPASGWGWSYVRISIGCSDFSLAEYTLCDEPGIEHFALTPHETQTLIPVLREILAVNPALRIMASPWTCPRWMKVEDLQSKKPRPEWTGGQLDPGRYADYARYLLLFVRAMRKAGIPIRSLTVQNEPLNRRNSASLYMPWEQQRDFIKTALGPLLALEPGAPELLAFDHNYNYDGIPGQDRYPLRIYADPDAARHLAGSAWHAYGGSYAELGRIAAAAPAKKIVFTEIAIGGWGYDFGGDLLWASENVALGPILAGATGSIVWNFMLDQNHGPKRPGGCQNCYGAVDVESPAYTNLTRRSHYYLVSHLALAFPPASRRIDLPGKLPPGVTAAAALRPDATCSAFFRNAAPSAAALILHLGRETARVTLPAKSLSTLLWAPGTRAAHVRFPREAPPKEGGPSPMNPLETKPWTRVK